MFVQGVSMIRSSWTGIQASWMISTMTSQDKNGHNRVETLYRYLMDWVVFHYDQHEEISGKAYKLLSDTKTYICVLLKDPWVVFFILKTTCGFPKSMQIYAFVSDNS